MYHEKEPGVTSPCSRGSYSARGTFTSSKSPFESIYRNPEQGELGYIRFEILFILSAVANTAVLIKFAGDSARLLHWSAVVWATTFTLVVLKFYTEEQMGWIDNNLKYDGIQIFHIVFAALLWNGVLRGSAA